MAEGALKVVSATREDQTAALVPHYIEWEAFASWVRSIVEVAHGIPVQFAAELNTRCPGFLDEAPATGTSDAEYETRFQRTMAWMEAYAFADMANASLLGVLRGAARNHLRTERIAEFWAACPFLNGATVRPTPIRLLKDGSRKRTITSGDRALHEI